MPQPRLEWSVYFNDKGDDGPYTSTTPFPAYEISNKVHSSVSDSVRVNLTR